MAEAQNLLRAEKWDDAHAALDKALAVPGLAGEPLQEVYAAKANGYASQKDFEKGRDACQKALDAAPDSPQVRMIRNLLPRAESELAKQKTKEQTPAAEPKAPAADAKTPAAAEAQKPAAAK